MRGTKWNSSNFLVFVRDILFCLFRFGVNLLTGLFLATRFVTTEAQDSDVTGGMCVFALLVIIFDTLSTMKSAVKIGLLNFRKTVFTREDACLSFVRASQPLPVSSEPQSDTIGAFLSVASAMCQSSCLLYMRRYSINARRLDIMLVLTCGLLTAMRIVFREKSYVASSVLAVCYFLYAVNSYEFLLYSITRLVVYSDIHL